MAPWPCAAAATLAAVELARAWLTATGAQRTTLLHTGIQLTGVAASWLVISRPRRRPADLGLHVAAAALAIMVAAATAQASTLHGDQETAAAMWPPRPLTSQSWD